MTKQVKFSELKELQIIRLESGDKLVVGDKKHTLTSGINFLIQKIIKDAFDDGICYRVYEGVQIGVDNAKLCELRPHGLIHAFERDTVSVLGEGSVQYILPEVDEDLEKKSTYLLWQKMRSVISFTTIEKNVKKYLRKTWKE